MRKFAFFVTLATALMAGNLNISNGVLKAHTEVFGDSTIDPESKVIESKLTMGDSIESIKGQVLVSLTDLKSDNEKRDEHMRDTLNIEKYLKATFNIDEVKKSEKNYILKGIMDLHGVKKEVEFSSEIKEQKDRVLMSGSGSILMSDFDITPPKLLFLSVRDLVDLSFDIELTKE